MKIIIKYLKIFLISLSTFIFGLTYLIFIWLDILIKNKIYNLVSFLWSKSILLISGIKVHIEGLEYFDPKKNYVITGNHQSLMDIPPLMAYFPGMLKWVFKKELGKVPVFGWVLNVAHIKVDRSNREKAKRSMTSIKNKLHKGTSVMIFPEGTRSKDGKIGTFKKGAFILALQNKVDILPYAIYGTREILKPQSVQINSGKVFISFRKPINIENYTFEKRNQLLEDCRNVIVNEYDRLRTQYGEQVKKN